MTQTTTTRRGFTCRCPVCGEEDTLRVYLSDVQTLTCGNCEAELTTEEVRTIIGRWQVLLAWLSTAPKIGGDT